MTVVREFMDLQKSDRRSPTHHHAQSGTGEEQ